MNNNKDNASIFADFVAVIAKLRDPKGGCPWDLEQTHESLKPYLIEEAYETLDAIDNDKSKLAEELGDVLLQVVLHAQVAKDNGNFDITEVITKVKNKMVERHPHVFGDVKVTSTGQVLKNWEQNKRAKDNKKSALESIPRQLPALLRAQRMGEKAARLGFDWQSSEDVKVKIKEEVNEFISANTKESAYEEFGDLLFALVQLGRKLDYNVEDCLQKANSKFAARFNKLEARAGDKMPELSLEQLEKLWQEIKQEQVSS